MERKVTHKSVILAKCHECCAAYEDGRDDCGNTLCPLYSFMPYRAMKPNLEWNKYNPRKKGFVTWEESKREFTPEQMESMKTRFKKDKTEKNVV